MKLYSGKDNWRLLILNKRTQCYIQIKNWTIQPQPHMCLLWSLFAETRAFTHGPERILGFQLELDLDVTYIVWCQIKLRFTRKMEGSSSTQLSLCLVYIIGCIIYINMHAVSFIFTYRIISPTQINGLTLVLF